MLKRSVPILMYHQITPRPVAALRKYMITPRAFAAQMRWLALTGYTPIALDVLLQARAGQIGLPRLPIVITFDDGFRDCADYAVPILQAHRFTAVFFLVTGLMGGTAEWLVDRFGVKLELINWADVQSLLSAGFECGSHTVKHYHLAELDAATCQRELRNSRASLEDHLGVPIRHLAYPYGSFNECVRDLVAESGYATACSTQLGLSTAADDALALRRVPINGQDSLPDFICRLRTGHNVHDTVHNAVRRVQRLKRSQRVQVA